MLIRYRMVIVCAVAGVCFYCVGLSHNVYAATYYIDAAAGNDANTGMATNQAWKTVAKINNATFQPGDTILFSKGGTWREKLIPPSSGSESSPITFGAYGSGDNPIISGADVLAGWTQNGSDWYANFSNKPNQVFEDDTRLTEVGSQGALVNGSWWYDTVNHLLYIRTVSGDQPSNHVMEAAVRDAVVSIFFKNYVRFENMIFEKATEGIEVYYNTKGHEYTGCTVRYMKNRGIFANGNAFNSWTESRLALAGGQQDPYGGDNAYAIIANNEDSYHFLYSTAFAANGVFRENQTYTFSFWAKEGAVQWNRLWINFRDASYATVKSCYVDVDVANGVSGTSVNIDNVHIAAEQVNGFRRIGVTCTAPAGDIGKTTLYLYPLEADGDTAFVGDGSTPSMYYYGPQLATSSAPEEYPYGDYPENFSIHDNTFYGIGTQTAGGDIATGNAVTGFHIYNNVMYGSASGDQGVDGVVMAQSSSGHVIENNIIYNHLREDGIDLKGIRKSTHTSGEHTIVRGNTVYGHRAQSGITCQMGTQNVYIYNNNVYNNIYALWVREYINDGQYGDTKEIYVYNNVWH